MATETLHYSGALTDFQLRQHRDGKKPQSIYCPMGHGYVPGGEGRAAELERQLQRERAGHDQTKAELKSTERRRRATAGQMTKPKKRVGRGVCPCCNRSFSDLGAHMNQQHPDFQSSEPLDGKET